MANRLRGEAMVPGSNLVVKYDIASFCAVEEASGMNINEAISAMSTAQPKLSTIRLLFWAGLLACQPTIGQDDAGAIMQDVGVASTAATVMAALKAAVVDTAEEPVSEGKL